VNNKQIKTLYQNIATGMATHLYNNQVIVDKIPFSVLDKKTSLNFKLIRKSDNHSDLAIIKNGSFFYLKANNKIKVKTQQLFRISTTGTLSTLKEFYGVKENHKGIKNSEKITTTSSNINKENFTRKLIKKLLSQTPGLFNKIKAARDYLFPEPSTDLSNSEGITFYIKADREDNKFTLTCYDSGGIFDEFLNAEGINYPSQVAGNYYADAYSILLFLQLHEETKKVFWLEAAEQSWEFIKRIYPQYLPAQIVWHHSDFKNAGILEVIKQYGNKYPQFSWPDKLLVEDHYEPTNVFALRFHWKSLAIKLKRKENCLKNINKNLAHLINDQTLDGLFHDNINTYPDAHDLTYHQYSTACLGQAISVNNDKLAIKCFFKAVHFTLYALGPDGEPAYTGRASNNIHQSASAIIAFHIAANLTNDRKFSIQLLNGAFSIAKRMQKFQQTTGMIPTALNKEINKRMAWNHCETPYNALAGYFLMRALDFSRKLNFEYADLPLQTSQCFLANDAGFATLSDNHQYIVIFSGCARSYAWSEGRHITGCAGIALHGYQGEESSSPSLDYPLPEDIPITDLPILNGKAAFGRGQLSKNSNGSIITYVHSYGSVKIKRCYQLVEDGLLIVTETTSDTEYTIDGILAWPMQWHEKIKCRHDITKQRITINQSKENLYIHYDCDSIQAMKNILLLPKISNAKGYCTIIKVGKKHAKGVFKSTFCISRNKEITKKLSSQLSV